MKKKILAVFLGICVILGSLSGCGIKNVGEAMNGLFADEATSAQKEVEKEEKEYPELTEKEYDKTVESVEELQEKMQVYVKDGEIPEENLEDAVTELQQEMENMIDSGDVDDYEVTDTGMSVQYSNGMKVFLELMETEESWDGTVSDSTLDVTTIEKLASGSQRRIALLQPYRDEDDCKDMREACDKICKEYDNFTLDVIWNVTLDVAATLDQYDIVLWEGHSFYSEDSSAVLFTSQRADYELYQQHKESGQRGIWYTTKVFDETMNARMAVDYKFFLDSYESGELDGMLIFLTLCNSMTDDVLSSVLLGKGTDMVLGYHSTVSFKYGHQMAGTIFEELSKGNTIETAIEEAKEENGDKDYTYSDWKTLFFYLGEYVPKSKVNTYLCAKGDMDYTVPETLEQRTSALDLADQPYWKIEYLWDECYFFENDNGGWMAQGSTDPFGGDFFYENSAEGDKDAIASKYNVYDYNCTYQNGTHIPITTEIFTGMTDVDVENVVDNDDDYNYNSEMSADDEMWYREREITYEKDGVLYTIGLIFVEQYNDQYETLILQGAGITYEEVE